MFFESVIGLEVHAQLKTQSKIFCGCPTRFGAPPNTNVCPVCLGMPGVLPVLNETVVNYSLRMALATHSAINRRNQFARKNYFYPDLPKGYQISQYELPIAEHGYIDILVDGQKRRIGITRIHMEEDAGKLIHAADRPESHVDLNRTGVPLIEIVSEPDMRAPGEAGAYLRTLRSLVRYIDICDGNMEEGSFRCDANISIRPKGQTALGTRTEIKNLNSFRHVEKALQYEAIRQQEIIEDGGEVVQETRLWDPQKQCTLSMRSKEEAHDYRYFPDPDLVPLVIDDDRIETIQKGLPELPDVKCRRFQEELGLPAYDAEVLTSQRPLADYFEECVKVAPHPKPVSNWIMSSLLGLLNSTDLSIEESPISARHLGELVNLIEDQTISGKIAKTVFEEMAQTSKPPLEVVEAKGLKQVKDSGAIEKVVDQVLAQNKSQVEDYRNGNSKILGFFVGQVMKATQGKANPRMVNQLLQEKLKV